MTEDIPGEGFFISALDSFVTRTCYGNAGGMISTVLCSHADAKYVTELCAA